MNLTKGFSRRDFLAHTSCFGACYALARHIPLPPLDPALDEGSRVAQTPLVDKGFASVRKIGNGLYATISDFSKGPTTVCNGGFLIGKDAALLIAGFSTPAGASFHMYPLRLANQVPVKSTSSTHFDLIHSMRSCFYSFNLIQVLATSNALK